MQNSFSFKIYRAVSELPDDWDMATGENIFLTTAYLRVLEISAPNNMECLYIGVYHRNAICGTAVSQFLDLENIRSFGERDHCIKNKIRTIIFKSFSSRVLILGNNMLTGQNAFAFRDRVGPGHINALMDAMLAIEKDFTARNMRPHLLIWKDFMTSDLGGFDIDRLKGYFKFSTQPNMQFDIPRHWHSNDDYIASLTKKYRDQYKRARKKAHGLTKRKLGLSEIIQYKSEISNLYLTVARNAPFNTFFLPDDHFIQMKQQLGDRFLLYGYFDGEKLAGFSSIIDNGEDVDTYFLGYDEFLQREKMLYLNMLYDMTAYSINQGFRRIIFARTALEIKSSVGAEPIKMFGFIKHNNALINSFLPRLFGYFEPELKWQQRHPFRP